MASLRQIRRRMKSVENINEITKAMEMIAAFRFRRAEGRFSRSRHYLREMEKLVANVSSSAAEVKDPLFIKRPVKKAALVVMTGDKGLCGAYNANLMRAALAWKLKCAAGVETFFVPVGKIGCEFYKRRHLPVLAAYPEKTSADLKLAVKITEDLKAAYLAEKADSVELLYTSFKVGASGRIQTAPFLPLNYLVEASKTGTAASDYIAEPDFDTLYVKLLKKYTEGKMYLTLLESLTSEYLARMVAMKQASDNGEEVLDGLKLLRNKTRQASITRELSEIVAGASILV